MIHTTQKQSKVKRAQKCVRALRPAITQSTKGQGKNERKRKETKHEIVYVESVLPSITSSRHYQNPSHPQWISSSVPLSSPGMSSS